MRDRFRTLPLLPLLVLAALSAPAAGAGTDGWLTSVERARTAAAERDAYILVDLFAEWCGWCKVLEREVFTTPAFSRFAADFVLLRVDVEDGGEGSALQARFGTYSLPTMLIVDADLAQVGAVVGYAPADAYLARLRGALDDHRTFLAYYDQVRRSDDPAALSALGEQLHERGDGKRALVVYERLSHVLPERSPEAARLRYLIADAHRLRGDWDRAAQAVARARDLARAIRDTPLVEQIDLLRAQIAQEAGDCEQAMTSLEGFLSAYPQSPRRNQARRVLDALRRGDALACS